MVKKNQSIAVISKDDFDGHEVLHLINCFVDTIDLIGAYELNVRFIVENSIVSNLKIHSCWFTKGWLLKNCIVHNYVDYQMGGHNAEPIVIDGNVFTDFFNFFDCQFDNSIVLRNNVFAMGTNLLGNQGEGYENSFRVGWHVENNVGVLDANEI